MVLIEADPKPGDLVVNEGVQALRPGAEGTVGRCFDPLQEWQQVATNVTGQALPAGHYIAEEVPGLLLAEALAFLR